MELSFMVDMGSVWRGILAMRWPYPEQKPKWGMRIERSPTLFLHAWTPMWHKGRGPYLTARMGWLAVYRGY